MMIARCLKSCFNPKLCFLAVSTPNKTSQQFFTPIFTSLPLPLHFFCLGLVSHSFYFKIYLP